MVSEKMTITLIHNKTHLKVGFARNISGIQKGVSLDIENYCTLRLFFELTKPAAWAASPEIASV